MILKCGRAPGSGKCLTSRSRSRFDLNLRHADRWDRVVGICGEQPPLLLRAGVTTAAEAAFQDGLWRPGLEPLQHLARIRIVHCTVAAEVALERKVRRMDDDPARRAHDVSPPDDAAAEAARHDAFNQVSIDAPCL
jgi:hypothetical protein